LTRLTDIFHFLKKEEKKYARGLIKSQLIKMTIHETSILKLSTVYQNRSKEHFNIYDFLMKKHYSLLLSFILSLIKRFKLFSKDQLGLLILLKELFMFTLNDNSPQWNFIFNQAFQGIRKEDELMKLLDYFKPGKLF
jgi:hypothetical protein